MKLDAPGLENHWVSLRPLTLEDKAALNASGAVDYMWQWMPMIEGGAGFDAYFLHTIKAYRSGEMIPFVVSQKGGEAFAGVAAYLEPNKAHRRVRVGYSWLPERLRGRGLFRATYLALLERAFDWGARRVECYADARNVPALTAYANIGFTEEGTMRDWQRLADGSWSDVRVFALLRSDWPAVRAQLLDSLGQLALPG